MYQFTYKGKIPSLNKWYSSNHWSGRNADKIRFSKIFKDMFSTMNIRPMEYFKIEMEYNSRVDPDNAIALVKIFVDNLKGVYVPNDDKRYFKGISIEPNLELPSYTYIIKLIPLDGNKERDKRPY